MKAELGSVMGDTCHLYAASRDLRKEQRAGGTWVVMLWIVSVITCAPGKPRWRNMNANTIKILSDSLFIFWGVYTSAGKTIHLYKKESGATKKARWPYKRNWRAQREPRLGKPEEIQPVWILTHHFNLIHCSSLHPNCEKEELTEEKNQLPLLFQRHFPARKEFNLWRSGGGRCAGTAYKAHSLWFKSMK